MSQSIILSGVIACFNSSLDAAQTVGRSLVSTFESVNLRLEELGESPVTPDNIGTTPYFELLKLFPNDDFVILLVADDLCTSFGKRVAAETRETYIVVSTIHLNASNADRLIRHELGHVFGFSEHLECVMSRYYVEDHGFCVHCADALSRRNIALRSNAMRRADDLEQQTIPD